MSDLLKVEERRLKRSGKNQERIREAWEIHVMPEFPHPFTLGFKSQVLTIAVESSAHHFELDRLLRSGAQQRMHEHPGVRLSEVRIKVCAVKIDEGPRPKTLEEHLFEYDGDYPKRPGGFDAGPDWDDAQGFVLQCGKYRGRTLGSIIEEDPEYIDWLGEEGALDDPDLLAAIKSVIQSHYHGIGQRRLRSK